MKKTVSNQVTGLQNTADLLHPILCTRTVDAETRFIEPLLWPESGHRRDSLLMPGAEWFGTIWAYDDSAQRSGDSANY